ncbi:MAG: hypothetical protein DBX55_07845 [Verrucomicrobia bacterium]|nr:MAG: hypothetical protein DBX55_07845 [Verrucomicrobiota bacterium]
MKVAAFFPGAALFGASAGCGSLAVFERRLSGSRDYLRLRRFSMPSSAFNFRHCCRLLNRRGLRHFARFWRGVRLLRSFESPAICEGVAAFESRYAERVEIFGMPVRLARAAFFGGCRQPAEMRSLKGPHSGCRGLRKNAGVLQGADGF